jgi:hypothetical protein
MAISFCTACNKPSDSATTYYKSGAKEVYKEIAIPSTNYRQALGTSFNPDISPKKKRNPHKLL